MDISGKQLLTPCAVALAVLAALHGCQREPSAEKSKALEPPQAVDEAAQRAVEAIQTPMDKARGVEGTLGEAADRTADRVKDAAP